MRVLVAHNSYRQPGGEDQVAAAEAALLERHGHEVVWFRRHNDDVRQSSYAGLAMKTIWNHSSYSALRALLRRTQPAVCHFHNTFPLISPAAFYAARAEKIPVVLTVHNYRLLCPGATLMRDGQVCQDCLSKAIPWPAVVHACYRQSRPATAATVTMLAAHRLLGTWSKAVDLYIAPSDFTRRKLLEAGLEPDKVALKPNFLESDPGFSCARETTALFVGRLAPEKGIQVMLDAWRMLDIPVRLRIVGDGPLAEQVSAAAEKDSRIEWLGALPRGQVMEHMRKAKVLLFPSTWYEVMPLTLIEACATGLPVAASALGVMTEIVEHGTTGLHFKAGDPLELARKVAWCWEHPRRLAEMGNAARRRYEDTYTPAANYRQLLNLYSSLSGARRATSFTD